MKLFKNSTKGQCDPDSDREFEMENTGNFTETL